MVLLAGLLTFEFCPFSRLQGEASLSLEKAFRVYRIPNVLCKPVFL